jgi:hypothetical protein
MLICIVFVCVWMYVYRCFFFLCLLCYYLAFHTHNNMAALFNIRRKLMLFVLFLLVLFAFASSSRYGDIPLASFAISYLIAYRKQECSKLHREAIVEQYGGCYAIEFYIICGSNNMLVSPACSLIVQLLIFLCMCVCVIPSFCLYY